MAYYIFLKSLRSLEEFRENPHVKIPLNLLLQISKALVNSKIQFLIQKFFFLISAWPTLRTTRPLGPAIPLAAPSPAGRKRPAGPSSPRVGRVFAESTFSFSDHAFPSWPLSPSVTATRAPPISFVVSPAPADPGQNFSPPRALPRAAAPRLGCPRAFTALPHRSPSLIPFKPSVKCP
jgi:hypothetical protein